MDWNRSTSLACIPQSGCLALLCHTVQSFVFCFVAVKVTTPEPADVDHSPVATPLALMLPQVRAVRVYTVYRYHSFIYCIKYRWQNAAVNKCEEK